MKIIKSDFTSILYLLCSFLVFIDANVITDKPVLNIEPFVTHGYEAEAHSAPFVVFLRRKSDINSTGQCGGTLISHNYVLTAGHCLRGAAAIDVFLGVHNLTSGSEYQRIVPAELWVTHSGVISEDDIGIIKLKESVNYTKGVQPVTLPSRSDTNKSYVGEIGKIFGWGLTEYMEPSDTLLYADMPIIDNKICQKPESLICAAKVLESGTCKGDSGSPLVVDGVLVGIVHGSRCGLGDRTSPSIFARLTKYLDWIEYHSDVIIN